MEYVISEEELQKLINFYDIENRKEVIGDDNSLKRIKRVIYDFLEPKSPVKLIVASKLDVDESGFIIIRDNIRLDEIIKNKDIKFYENIKIYIQKENKKRK